MKRMTAAIALPVTLLFAGTFLWRNVKVQAMSVQVNVRDLPEHGVRIIAPSDPSFDQRAQPFLKDQPKTMVDRIKPFSVIVENMAGLAIVGSRLNWEIVQLDGNVYRARIGSSNPRALMGGNKSIQTTRGAAIPPHSIRFVSLLGSASEGEQVDLRNFELSFRGSQSELEEFNNALLQGNREEAFNKSDIAKVIRDATSVTVSIDGIFFEDGTFVGDDKTGFFDEVKAYIDAEYDLITEISIAQTQGKTPDEIFGQVRDFLATHSGPGSEHPPSQNYGSRIGGGQELTAPASISFSSNSYQRYKAMYAQNLLRKKEALGAKQAIGEALKLLEKPRVELRRR
jgi:hypothetical protein